MQSDKSEKGRMDSTRKNLFENLTKRSEETLGAGAISEDSTQKTTSGKKKTFATVR